MQFAGAGYFVVLSIDIGGCCFGNIYTFQTIAQRSKINIAMSIGFFSYLDGV